MIGFTWRQTGWLIAMVFALFLGRLDTAWPEMNSQAGFPGQSGERLKLITDIEASYAYSDIKDSDSLSGGVMDVLIAGSWKMKENRFLILKYDGGYEKKLDFYSDDYGQRQRTEFQEHTLTPMLRLGVGHATGISVIPSLFYTATLNKDNSSTGWNDGLYNYYDAGAGIDFEFGKTGFGSGNGLLTFGFQYYKRHYPNFVSLLDLATENEDLGRISALDTEKDEKDYAGILAMVEYLWVSGSGFSWNAEYTVLYKKLDDKKVVDLNGSLTDTEQMDHVHTLKFQGTVQLRNNLQAGLTLGANLNKSNQNFWDGMESFTYVDDVATKNYFDHYAYGLQPEISYDFYPAPLMCTTYYLFHKTNYLHRKAKTAAGDYQNQKQRDTEKTFFMELAYIVSDQWRIHANWTNTRSKSNNHDERYYLYDYTLNVYSIGLSFHY
ncbi:MAG: hypothetical protein C4522_10880 [Desulfobacteraceae bacterium]|nr:MAG: hypothetical protein C4522_10880 [Desulfobacteraceae bacterium]